MTATDSQTIDLNTVQAQPEPPEMMFSQDIYDNLPEFLKTTCGKLNGNNKDVYFAGSLASISAVLPNIQFDYDGSYIESNLFLFVLGAYGSGKGSLKYAQAIVKPFHEFLRSQERPNEGGEVEKRLLFLPANSSKSGIIELLQAQQRGLIFETESDVLTDQLKQDYGNFSDLLRASYQHETVKFYRRLNKEYYEIDRPKLSVLLSGTPGQLRKLIPTIENGLFSRFMFYRIAPEREFKNIFATNGQNLEQWFYQAGRKLLFLFEWLNGQSEPFEFQFTESQQAEFHKYFNDLKGSLIDTFGEAIAGNVHRFGVQFVRVAMILSALRAANEKLTFAPLVCTDQDFTNARRIMETFINNALEVFETLNTEPPTDIPENKLLFVQALPPEFTTSQAIETGQRFGVSERSVTYWLNDRKLFAYLKRGHYAKK
jgi:hypothetical protein